MTSSYIKFQSTSLGMHKNAT